MSREVLLLLAFAVLVLVAARLTTRPGTAPKEPGTGGRAEPSESGRRP